MEITKQLQNPDFRFILIRPKEKAPYEMQWQKVRNYHPQHKRLELHKGNLGIVADKLFFEEVKAISVKAMYNKVKKVRDGIESQDYHCKPGILCRWCDFNGECEAFK